MSRMALVCIGSILAACGSTLELGDRASGASSPRDAGSSGDVGPAPNDRDGGAGADGGTGADAGEAPTCGRGTPTPECKVFLTDARVEANFGGLAGADARCRAAAEGAKLRGRFKAYLSDGVIAAWSRFVGDGPWLLVGSMERVFSEASELKFEGARPLDRNERGELLGITGHWTGVREQGFGGDACDGFTSLSPDLEGSFGNTAPSRWLYQAKISCDSPVGFHLLCLED